jgi:hypothetical protein
VRAALFALFAINIAPQRFGGDTGPCNEALLQRVGEPQRELE